jgi:hypothetical protein
LEEFGPKSVVACVLDRFQQNLGHFGGKEIIVLLYSFLLSTYEIWKVLVSLAIFFLLQNFHVLGLFIPEKRV